MRLMSATFVFPSTTRWLLLGGATAALAPSVMGLHGERNDALSPRLDPAGLATTMIAAGLSSTLLSSVPLRRPVLNVVPIAGAEAAAFSVAWYWYLMSVGEEVEEQTGLPGGFGGGLVPRAPAAPIVPPDDLSVGTWTNRQVAWTARRLIEGLTIWNAAVFVRSFFEARRAATEKGVSMLAAKAAASPLPTVRPFGIPALVGALLAPAIYQQRVIEEIGHHNTPVHV